MSGEGGGVNDFAKLCPAGAGSGAELTQPTVAHCLVCPPPRVLKRHCFPHVHSSCFHTDTIQSLPFKGFIYHGCCFFYVIVIQHFALCFVVVVVVVAVARKPLNLGLQCYGLRCK